MITVTITDQAACEMTILPLDTIHWDDFRKTTSLLRTSVKDLPKIKEMLDQALACRFPVEVKGMGQPFLLAARPLSYKYQQPILHFTSAHAPLLQFLQKDAFYYQEIGNTCSTLFLNENSNQLVGFCAIKCSSLKQKGSTIRTLCPAIEIAALCVDDQYRNKGIGQLIFLYAIQQIWQIRSCVGVQFITLFSVPKAVNFYRKFQFQTLKRGMKILSTSCHQSCIPMFLSLPPIELSKP